MALGFAVGGLTNASMEQKIAASRDFSGYATYRDLTREAPTFRGSLEDDSISGVCMEISDP